MTTNIVKSQWSRVATRFAIFYLLFTLFAVKTFAAFLNTPATARLAALGGSYVAIANDAAALTFNPAGLGSVEQPEVVSDYSRLYTGLSDGSQISQMYLGGAMPLSFGGTAAFGWKEFHFDGLYTERTLSLGYGRWWTPRLAMGVSIKQFHHAYRPSNQIVDDFGNIQSGTPDLFVENGTEKSAYSADAGILYKWTAQTTVGFATQDMNEPNVALSSHDRDVVGRTCRLGVASLVKPGLTLASSVHTQQALADQRDWIWTGGIERANAKIASGKLGLRGSFSLGTRDMREGAIGAGYGIGNLQLDYAFAMALTGLTFGDTSGQHRFSLTYRFKSVRPMRLDSPTKTDQPILPVTRAPRSVEIEIIELL